MRLCIGAIITAAAIIGCHHANADDTTQPGEKKFVLFDGKDTSAWQHADGSACKWEIQKDDSMQVKGGDIFTKQKFNDCRVHVEFWIPKYPDDVKGQKRGNSGVYLMG